MMQEFLSKMIGRKLDIVCGTSSSLRGEVVKVEEGVLHMKEPDQKPFYVAIEKIVAVWEASNEEHQAGFVPKTLNNNKA